MDVLWGACPFTCEELEVSVEVAAEFAMVACEDLAENTQRRREWVILYGLRTPMEWEKEERGTITELISPIACESHCLLLLRA